MSSVWTRTACRAEWTKHHVVLEKRTVDGHATSSFDIPWGEKEKIEAMITERLRGLWSWQVRQGGFYMSSGTSKSEAGAKRQALKLVKELIRVNEQLYRTTTQINHALSSGWTVHPDYPFVENTDAR